MTRMIPVEELQHGHVVVTRDGALRLSIHSVVGMPDDLTILGHLLNANGSRGENQAWPIRDLPRVRIEK